MAKRDCALAVVVLSVEPLLLYLLGAPKDPQVVWTRLEEQFQRKTWSNRLQLRKRLFSLQLKDGGSVSEHVKAMTEIFEAHAVIGDTLTKEDRVVHLLASLPDSYNMLVTALEAQSKNVPKWELVTERLLHEELKLNEKAPISTDIHGRKVLLASKPSYDHPVRQTLTCHYCKKPGHIMRNCRKLAQNQKYRGISGRQGFVKQKHSSNHPAISTDQDDESFVASMNQAMSTTADHDNRIIDSGATCHMCNYKELFVEWRPMEVQDVLLGDGHKLEATAVGTVSIDMLLPDGKTKKCSLHDVLYVPRLSCNLLSVSKADKAKKAVHFWNGGCEIVNSKNEVIALATKVGKLYYLEFCEKQQANIAEKNSKEKLWHRRYGHLGEQNLKLLATKNMVDQFDYNAERSIGFCESCVGGKHHRSQFEICDYHAQEPLELVHSDVYGKISEKTTGGAEYFLTFTDDKTCYFLGLLTEIKGPSF